MSDDRIQPGSPKPKISEFREGPPPIEERERSDYGWLATTDSEISSAWRDKRITFNMILIGSVLVSLLVGATQTPDLTCGVSFFYTGAVFFFFNMFFFWGPDVENLLCWVGVNRPWARGISFFAGATIAALIIVLVPLAFFRAIASIGN